MIKLKGQGNGLKSMEFSIPRLIPLPLQVLNLLLILIPVGQNYFSKKIKKKVDLPGYGKEIFNPFQSRFN